MNEAGILQDGEPFELLNGQSTLCGREGAECWSSGAGSAGRRRLSGGFGVFIRRTIGLEILAYNTNEIVQNCLIFKISKAEICLISFLDYI